MSDISPRLKLPYIQPSQAQKHVTHNEALRLLDTLVQLVVRRLDGAVPPPDPAPGAVYGLGAAPVGEWAGQAGMLAIREGASWRFAVPQEGWRAWDLESMQAQVYTGGAWQPEQRALDNLESVGIGTSADAFNRLAVAAEATLLTHAGAGHQLKLNKAAVGDTASLLFQTGYEGRAEMGLAGEDAFAIKMCAPGGAWSEGLRLDPVAHSVTLANGSDAELRLSDAGLACRQSAGGVPGTWQDIYSQGNAVGNVQQSAGAITGALIERGSNGDGEYVRFADGTQICWFTSGADSLLGSASGALYWAEEVCNFPAAFIGVPVVAPTALNMSSGLCWGGVSGQPSAASFTFQAVGTASGGAYRLSYMATGRWF